MPGHYVVARLYACRMAIGLKMDLEFFDPENPSNGATFGDLKRFVKRGEAGGVPDDHPLILETSERDEITGFSVFLDVDF